MESKVKLRCEHLDTELTLTLDQANRLLKIQGKDPKDGWSLNDDKYQLNEHGVIIRRIKSTNSRAAQ